MGLFAICLMYGKKWRSNSNLKNPIYFMWWAGLDGKKNYLV